MVNMIPGDPFSTTELKPLGTHSRIGSHIGILMPDGNLVVNFNDSTRQDILRGIADTIKAELVIVTGTWTFVPDDTTEFRKIARGSKA